MNRLTPISASFLGLATVLATGCTMSVHTNGQPETESVATLPQEVRHALDRASETYLFPLSGAQWLQLETLSGSGHPIYQVRGKNGRGNTIEIEVTKAGRVIEVEEHGIAMEEVPSVVVAALRAKRPDFTATHVEAIYQGQKPEPVAYGFEGTDGGGASIEVYLAADGKTFLN